jgi:translocation and assembly module TamA
MSRSARNFLRHFCATAFGLLIAASSITATAQAASPYELAGIQGALRDNVEAHLSALELPCGAPRWQAGAVVPRARSAARNALEALGYYNPSIKATLQRQNDCWRVRLDIQAGPPVRITQLDIAATGAGRDAPGLTTLLSHPGLKLGEVLDQGAYNDLRNRLERYARDHGYFDAKFTAHEILVDPTSNTARIRLILDTGSRYKFGATTLQQNVLEPRVVRGFLSYQQGQPYTSDAVVESQSTLAGTGYFGTVRLRSEVNRRSGGEVPMHLTLSPARHYQLLTGVGYATDTGPRLRLDFRNRRVNRAGHRYAFTSQLSPVQSQAGFKYEIPLSNPRTDWLTLQSGYQYEKTDTALTHSWKLGVIRTHQMGNHWLRRLSLEYLHETSTVGGQSLTSQLLIPGIGFSRTVSDSPIYPNRGWSVSTELRGAAKGPISDVSFAQLTLNLKDVHPLGSGRVFTRLSLGATSVSDVTLLPASLRFFAGGDSSVRGYAYQSLGPKDSEGNIIGGKYLATASAEYEHRLHGDFYWAAFYDVGNAFNTLPLDPHRGVGLGLRWHSPLGPIRLDVAHPLDGEGNYIRLHVSMGTEL